MNGVRSDQSNVTLDGIGVNDQNNGYAFSSVLNAPPDSVEEFRVTTANSNADTGYSSGGQVALVTKSGTNSFHGSAYEYNRNTIFSANDPFLKNSQLISGQSNKAPKLLRNVFGVTLGGPIVKNRLFFFANYEGRRDAEGSSTLRTVPSPTLRAGILVYLCADPTQCPGGNVTGIDNKQYPVQAGYNGLNFNQIKGMDPKGIGVNQAVLTLLNQYPRGQRIQRRRWFEYIWVSLFPKRETQFQHLHYPSRLPHHVERLGDSVCARRDAKLQGTGSGTISWGAAQPRTYWTTAKASPSDSRHCSLPG